MQPAGVPQMTPFRERNPVIIGVIGIALIALMMLAMLTPFR